MKKLVLTTLIVVVYLTGFAKPNEVVPFLQSSAKGLPEKTNVPVLLPTYWKEQTKKPKRHTAVKVKAYENGYVIYFLSMDKHYRANDPALFHPRESSKTGELSGYVGNMTASERPKNFVFYKKKDGVSLWIQPWIKSIIYAKRGPWTLRFDGDNGDEPYQQADELFKAMKKADWLKSKIIHKGHISILGTRHEAYTSISWETTDGYVYHFSYYGPIKEAVKITDSLKYVK
ncbi:hypothetical protein P9D43_21775 [Neobacillus niacini]|uniref:hypothetical protein n=1 Tax=Neobacillus niacini TaxID=86668 RepID=UPI0007AC2523|nr:hypothetical protein [Neobacillus niacini]MEC1524637.1 hypothetical protein [Neobacillus niacini]